MTNNKVQLELEQKKVKWIQNNVDFYKHFKTNFTQLAWDFNPQTAKEFINYLREQNYFKMAHVAASNIFPEFKKDFPEEKNDNWLFRKICEVIGYDSFIGYKREKKSWAHAYKDFGAYSCKRKQEWDNLGIDLIAFKGNNSIAIQVKPGFFHKLTLAEKNKIFERMDQGNRAILEAGEINKSSKLQVYCIDEDWNLHIYNDTRELKEKRNIDRLPEKIEEEKNEKIPDDWIRFDND